MKMITGVSKMCCDGVIQYLEKEKVSILIKDRHTCLDLNDSNMYVLKEYLNLDRDKSTFKSHRDFCF